MAQATAKLNFLKMAPRKVRLIANALKGLSALEAEAQLLHRPQRASRPLLNLLRSCVNNAKNAKLNVDQLVIAKISVDQGPMLKRWLPRAMGRATPIQKKMSHVILILEESDKVRPPRYKIVPVKKVKKEDDKKAKSAAKKTSKPEANKPPKREVNKEKEGFFKRIFRRKSV